MMRGALGGKIDTWDIQWAYTIIENEGLCITPLFNQLKNIGYEGTHFSGTASPAFEMPTRDIDLEDIRHPSDSADAASLDDIALCNFIRIYRLDRGFVELLINRLKKEMKKFTG
jgi:hypothetical protein